MASSANKLRAGLKALLAGLAAALLLGLAAGPARAATPMKLGMNVLWIPGDAAVLRERFRKARALGITEVRLDWEWRQAEGQRGRYDWRKFDVLVAAAHAEGVNLLPIVHYAPKWAEGGVSLFSLTLFGASSTIYEMAPAESAYGDYAKFLRASVQRYGPGGNAPVAFTPIKAWQVWNEPNLPQFWSPAPNAAAYAKLMKQVQSTMAPLRSQITLVHAGLSKPDLNYVWALWNANPQHGDSFDVMAVHPYLYDAKDGIRAPEAMDADDPNMAALGFVGSSHDPGFLGKVFNLQIFMTLRGAPGKPIWATEVGYFIAPTHPLGVTEAGQAERLTATLDFIDQRLMGQPYGSGPRALATNVQRVYGFALEDYPSPDGLGAFGVYRPDGSLRPSGEALRQRLR